MPLKCNGKVYSLLLAAITRWGKQQWALQSLERVKPALLTFCTDPAAHIEAGLQNSLHGIAQSSTSSESTSQLRKVLETLNDPAFWRAISCLPAILEPITSAQKQSECDRAYVHRVIPRWLGIQRHWLQLQSSRKWHEVDWSMLQLQFTTRFAKQTTDIHYAAFSFDPESFSDGALIMGQK